MAKKELFEVNTGRNILGTLDTSNMLLLNVYYSKPYTDDEGNKVPDVCTVVYKDTSDNSKHVMEIENPLMKMYVVKEEYRDFSYYPEFMPKDKCDIWIFPYHSVLSKIATLAPPHIKEMIKHFRDTKNYYSMKKLHHLPCVLGTDFPYENYFRIEWVINYANPNINTKITKQFLDIEVDTIDVKGMPQEGECPINAVTVVDEELGTVFTFLLRNPKNPQIQEFEDDIHNFIEECHASFDESYGELKYKIYMYDDELEMIKQIFKMINTLKRDFVLIWNLSFDIPYFMDRLTYLGKDPIDYMCSPDFKYKYCWFRKDRRNFDFKTKKDVFRLASYSIFSDQMINYAKVRKGQSELASMKLNSIAQSELGDEKLDYTDEANIKTLPYVNYRKFVLYNIKDVLLQLGIERKTKDLEAIFQRAYDNATDYDSIFSQTIFLKNRVFLDYYRELGIIKGNNINIKYDNASDDIEDSDTDQEYELDENGDPDWTRPKAKGFEGALVGDPLNNSYEGITFFGKQSMFIFDNVIDFDFSSLYPSIIISNNIGQNPLIGKVVLKQKMKHLNPDPTNAKYDPAKEFFEDISTLNYAKIGNRWFNLPTIEEVLREMEAEANED